MKTTRTIKRWTKGKGATRKVPLSVGDLFLVKSFTEGEKIYFYLIKEILTKEQRKHNNYFNTFFAIEYDCKNKTSNTEGIELEYVIYPESDEQYRIVKMKQ